MQNIDSKICRALSSTITSPTIFVHPTSSTSKESYTEAVVNKKTVPTMTNTQMATFSKAGTVVNKKAVHIIENIRIPTSSKAGSSKRSFEKSQIEAQNDSIEHRAKKSKVSDLVISSTLPSKAQNKSIITDAVNGNSTLHFFHVFLNDFIVFFRKALSSELVIINFDEMVKKIEKLENENKQYKNENKEIVERNTALQIALVAATKFPAPPLFEEKVYLEFLFFKN